MAVMKETKVQTDIRLAASRVGVVLWRNNVGACTDETGRLIRYGLCNDSKQLADVMKSSDLVGIRPLTIRPEHVGQTIGVFVAIECKEPNWKRIPSDKRAEAQERWQGVVRQFGGIAGFAKSVDEFLEIIRC